MVERLSFAYSFGDLRAKKVFFRLALFYFPFCVSDRLTLVFRSTLFKHQPPFLYSPNLLNSHHYFSTFNSIFKLQTQTSNSLTFNIANCKFLTLFFRVVLYLDI